METDQAQPTQMETNLECYLKTHRRRVGLTQDELATLVGYETGAVVSRLERLLRHPTLEIAYGFEIILEHSPKELFPSLHARVKSEVVARTRARYEELQGYSSKANKIKLDFFEDILTKWDDGPTKRV
jgi:transcriptional regulator with XRE-family HTH domain